MNKKGMILIIFLVFLNGCFVSKEEDLECVSDSDCVSAGCSSQLCVGASESKGIITTCEYRDEYACLELSSCGCVDNKCQWNENKEYVECLDGVKI